jgi:hypothetical protein
MVRDAAAMLTGEPEEAFTATIIPDLSDEINTKVQAAKEARTRLHSTEAEAAANRDATSTLAAEGLTVRDIGAILEVSHQFAHHLVRAA